MKSKKNATRCWIRFSQLHQMAVVVIGLMLVSAVSAQPLQGRIDEAIRTHRPKNSEIAVYVTDLSTGKIWASVNGNHLIIPASNLKILTTAVALDVLGADYNFETKLLTKDGNLIVVGSGDPAFGDAKLLGQLSKPMNIEELLLRWVKVVKQGEAGKFDQLILDDRVFDRQWTHANWPSEQLHKWYCAEVAGINFNNNCLDIYAVPTRPGQTPHIKTFPLYAPVELSNSAKTGRDNALWASRVPDTNRIIIRGSVKHRLQSPIWVTIHDPAMFFGKTFAQRLKMSGIKINKTRHANDDESFTDAKLLARVKTPIGVVLKRCNSDSQNLFAECLLKSLGKKLTGEPGSWTNGAAAMRSHLNKIVGSDAINLVIDDGSGLSKHNRVTTKLMVKVLGYMHSQKKLWPIFKDSLSIAGERGTLRKRFNKGKVKGIVYAKSGYIRGVYSLSGYIVHDHKIVAFSIILNQYPSGGKTLIDAIVAEIDKEMRKQK